MWLSPAMGGGEVELGSDDGPNRRVKVIRKGSGGSNGEFCVLYVVTKWTGESKSSGLGFR